MIRHLSGIRTDYATAHMISSFMKKSNKRCLFCLMLIQGDSRGGKYWKFSVQASHQLQLLAAVSKGNNQS